MNSLYLDVAEEHLGVVVDLVLFEIVGDVAEQRHFGHGEQVGQLDHLLGGDALQRALVTALVVLQRTTALHVAPAHRPVLVNVQDFGVAELTAAAVDGAQLDLQEAVQLEE